MYPAVVVLAVLGILVSNMRCDSYSFGGLYQARLSSSVLSEMKLYGYFSHHRVTKIPAFRAAAILRHVKALHGSSALEYDTEDSYQQPAAALKQLQLRFDCNNIDSDELTELLHEVGSLSVSCEVETENTEYLNDESHWLDLVKTKSWAKALLRANFPATFDIDGIIDILNVSYGQDDGSTPFESIAVEPVADIDWVSHVQQDWKPQVIGDLVIKFPWHRDLLPGELPTNVKHQLVLEGGAAFGTGDHPTTRLCCRWLARMIASDLGTNIDLIDYGCGSGILGLAARRYGIQGRVVGTDIDRDALFSAANNCAANDLDMELFVADSDSSMSDSQSDAALHQQSIVMNKFRGSGSSDTGTTTDSQTPQSHFPSTDLLQGSSFHITVANILAPILINLAAELAKLTKPNGVIGLSGIVTKQADIVINAFRKHFDDVKIEEEEDGWVLITGRRPPS